MGFPGGSAAKNLPVTHEVQVPFLGLEGPLEEGMATQVFMPGGSPEQRSLVGYSPYSHKESDMTEQLNSNMQR